MVVVGLSTRSSPGGEKKSHREIARIKITRAQEESALLFRNFLRGA